MRRVYGAIAAFAVLAGACGGSASSATNGGRTIQIEMREFAYSPAELALTPGEKVVLRFKNTGTVEHEFMAGSGPTAGKGYATDWLATARTDKTKGHDDAHTGEGLKVSARQTGQIAITVPSQGGEIEFGCFVAGHYEAGMKGKIVIR